MIVARQSTQKYIAISELRQHLNRLDDVQIDALALDHFPQIYDKFSRGLQRVEKINMLLDYCHRNPEGIPVLTLLLDVPSPTPTHLVNTACKKEEDVKINQHAVLLDILENRFQEADLRRATFEIFGPGAYNNLRGQTYSERAISFIEQLYTRNKVFDFIDYIRKNRPDIKF